MSLVTLHLADRLCELALEHICPQGPALSPESRAAIARSTSHPDLCHVRVIECDSTVAADLARYFAAWHAAFSGQSPAFALVFAEAEDAARNALACRGAPADRGAPAAAQEPVPSSARA